MNYQELIQQASTGHASDSPYKNSLTIKTESLKTKTKNSDDTSSSLQYFYDQEHIQKMNAINEKALGEKKRRQEAREKAELGNNEKFKYALFHYEKLKLNFD